jgi:hypothetical protein
LVNAIEAYVQGLVCITRVIEAYDDTGDEDKFDQDGRQCIGSTMRSREVAFRVVRHITVPGYSESHEKGPEKKSSPTVESYNVWFEETGNQIELALGYVGKISQNPFDPSHPDNLKSASALMRVIVSQCDKTQPPARHDTSLGLLHDAAVLTDSCMANTRLLLVDYPQHVEDPIGNAALIYHEQAALLLLKARHECLMAGQPH